MTTESVRGRSRLHDAHEPACKERLGRAVWDVDSLECGALHAGCSDVAFRTTVDQLRDVYDRA